MLRAVANIYNDPSLIPEAEVIEAYIRKNTMVNGFFCDNAYRRENGNLELSGECTETCQYYAFYLGIASPETYPELWKILTTDFGPQRKQTGAYPEIFFANAFIGNYLRLDLLMREGEKEKLEENIRGYFDYMALRTGTLWENDTPHASCNHGFASHVLIWLDYLGYID
jgi:alpha-L-rhamnosidase